MKTIVRGRQAKKPPNCFEDFKILFFPAVNLKGVTQFEHPAVGSQELEPK